MARPRFSSVIFIALTVFIFAAGCTVVPKKALTSADIPTGTGTSYTAYQNSPDVSYELSFSGEGPWDFSRGPAAAKVKSVIIDKKAGASFKSFSQATYAEKVLPSEFTSGYTAYNFASKSSSSLNSYGQSFTPGPDGPIANAYERPERLLKFPVRVGDEWTDTIKAEGENPVTIKLNRKVIARGQVKVPAGSFFNCFMIRLIKTAETGEGTQATRSIMYFWWAPDVGLVAAVGSLPDETETFFKRADYVFRLKSYEVKD
jgi:hypothetical protein